MAEYVDKEIAMMVHEPPKSQRYYQTDNLDDAYGQGWDDALNAIGKLPRVNVKEIIYAHWIDYQVPHISCCSYCDWGINPLDKSPYCPNCGAEMSEVIE